MAKTTVYEPRDKKTGMTIEELGDIVREHVSSAQVRAEVGFASLGKTGAPIKKIVVEEP